MSARTWVLMIAILLLNWGGFIAALAYSLRRESRPRSSATSREPSGRPGGAL